MVNQEMIDRRDDTCCCREIAHGNRALKVLNGKWKVLIILCLRNGHSRFSDIARNLPNITFRMLSKELKQLEQSGLVVRQVFEKSQFRIGYELTPIAATLDPLLDEIISWGEQIQP